MVVVVIVDDIFVFEILRHAANLEKCGNHVLTSPQAVRRTEVGVQFLSAAIERVGTSHNAFKHRPMAPPPPPRSLPPAQQDHEQQLSHYHHHMASLLASTLEMWCHQLLYVRHIYPRDSFTATTFLDLDGCCCYVQRHVAVVQYISEAVQMAIPTLLNGIADQFSLLVLEKTTTTTTTDSNNSNFDLVELERYTLHVLDMTPTTTLPISKHTEPTTAASTAAAATTLDNEVLRQREADWRRLERAVRNLILQVHSSCQATARKASKRSPRNLTFKILLHVMPSTEAAERAHGSINANQQQQQAKHLVHQAITEGRWWCNPSQSPPLLSSSSSTTAVDTTTANGATLSDSKETTTRSVSRPLYQLDQGGLRINFVAQVVQNHNSIYQNV